ncbi:MAG TPA: hypothetical protein VLT45_01395 [Kofleriaceae bacterium]|nr:hypothetical protein [Kofleriaceae bacterium]
MQIPVGYQTSTAIKDIVDYRCRACGARRRAEVLGIGIGQQTFLNSSGTARRRARDNARHELKRTIRFAACPACHKRSGHLKFLTPYLVLIGLFVAIGVVAGYAPTWFDMNMGEHDKAICRTYITWGFMIFALLAGLLPMWWRWTHNDRRVTWLDGI